MTPDTSAQEVYIRSPMRLRKLLLGLVLSLTAFVLALVLHTLSGAVVELRQGTEGLQSMETLRLLLSAAEMASRERGPANGVMGDDLPHDSDKLARLSEARRTTDAAFSAADKAVQSAPDDPAKLRAILSQAQSQLLQGRQSIDAVAAEPRRGRSPEQIRHAIAQMFEVIDDLTPATLRLTQVVQATYPKEANLLLAARVAADLREYAGRLGSHFTIALTKRERIEPEEYAAVEQLFGRIDQLHTTLLAHVQNVEGNERINQATAVMQSRYFGSAIPYIRAQLAAGLRDAAYSVDAAGFAKRYVPDMDSIVELRDVLIDEAVGHSRLEQTAARRAAYVVIFLATGTVLLLAGILLLLQYRLSRPLQGAIELILGVAHGLLDRPIPKPRYRDEVGDMLEAIAVLRNNSLARLELEKERQDLLARLKEQASTDFLTDLPNRRGFFELVESTYAMQHRQGLPISVALFDVDHFKRVNDNHGHGAGDVVLREIAQTCKTHLRSGDIVARFGGEEFLLLMPHCQLSAAVRKAEELRALIEQTVIELPDGQTLKVTASFGVDMCLPQDDTLHDVIKRCDEKLYLAKGGGRNQVV